MPDLNPLPDIDASEKVRVRPGADEIEVVAIDFVE